MSPDLAAPGFAELETGAAARGLTVLGGFHDGRGTTILLGPDSATFWGILRASPEADGPNPVDRWSTRVVGAWAAALGARALFPFGTPLQPFVTWALRTGRCHVSPVGLLVHDAQGLMVSFRAALAFDHRLTLPPAPPSPCIGCPEPCRGACPVDALAPTGYDTARCHDWLDDPRGDCMERGCAARRACPASPDRPPAQSAHHMAHFHR